MQTKTKKILKRIALILSILIVTFILFITFGIYFYSPGYPPNDQRDDHNFFKNKKLQIPKEIYNLEPNTLGLFIRNYELFKDYDTSQVDFSFTIYNKKDGYLGSNTAIDSSLYYDEIEFIIDNKSYIHDLTIRKGFNNTHKLEFVHLKDSIHNLVSKQFRILKNFYGQNFAIYLDKGDETIPNQIVVLWNVRNSYIRLDFPNIYDNNSVRVYDKNYIYHAWLVDFTINLNADNISFFKKEIKAMKEVTHLYNPKFMGWE